MTIVDGQMDGCLTIAILGSQVLVARLEQLVDNLEKRPIY